MSANDSLLSCLELLSEILGRPASQGNILAGLPIIEERLPVELFPRAASHLDLSAQLKKIKLKNKAFHFPIPLVLLLEDEEACLLTDITNRGTVKIIHPPNTSQTEIPYEELMSVYTGRAFVVEPDAHFVAEGHHAERDTTSKRWFWLPINRLWSPYSEVLIASILINLFALAVPLFMMNVYDRVIPNRIFDTLLVFASGIFIIFVFDMLMRILRSYFIDQAAKIIDLQVSASIIAKVLGIRMIDRPRSIGAFANTIESFNAVRDFITSATITVLVDLPFSLLFLAIIALIGGSLVFVPLIMLPVTILFGYLLQKPYMQFTKVVNRYSAEKEAILYETLNGIEVLKTNGAEPVIQSKWEQAINHAAQAGIKLRFISNLGIFFSFFVQQLAILFVVIVGVYMITDNQLTIGGLLACAILASRALAPMLQIFSIMMRYHQTKCALESLNKVMSLPIEKPLGRVAFSATGLKGAIELHDVSFSFPHQQQLILDKLSFKIAEGEHVGIIGRVGSGKTTLAKIIMGLLQPSSGVICFDDVQQHHLDIHELRRQIGYVPQDVILFHGTLHDNIVFGAPYVDDKNILNAIDVAGIDEFLKSKLGGYEANIVEGGKNISSGQRQMIAIARAVLLDPPILVMDVPFNSIDTHTEAVIKQKLEKYTKNKTLIVLTHKPTLLSLVNRLIILHNGKVVADGPKDVILLALSEGKITIPKDE